MFNCWNLGRSGIKSTRKLLLHVIRTIYTAFPSKWPQTWRFISLKRHLVRFFSLIHPKITLLSRQRAEWREPEKLWAIDKAFWLMNSSKGAYFMPQNESSLFTATKTINHGFAASPDNEIVSTLNAECFKISYTNSCSMSRLPSLPPLTPPPRWEKGNLPIIECQIELSKPSIISRKMLLIKFRALI